jgi:CheY-like chemotaxis protein
MRTGRILVVDDEETNHLIARLALERAGHVVDCAGTGEQALVLLRRYDYDLVLMDTGLPGMDGVEAAKRIRSGEAGAANPHVPVVALTGAVWEEDRRRALESGMDEYLTKPIQRAELAAVAERWVGARGFQRSVATEADGRGSDHGGTVDTSISGGETAGGGELRILDYAGLLQRVGHDTGAAREVLELLQQDLAEHVAQCREALEARNVQAIERISHVVLNSTLIVGAERLADLARRLEAMAQSRSGRLETISARVEELAQAIGEVDQEITRILR